MEAAYDRTIRPILDVYDEIREILKDIKKIELPKIVVVGDQSSGKSSVLESITGINLPRGENTVTKCPIIIQLRGVNKEKDEYAIVRIEGEVLFGLEKIKLDEIESEIRLKQEEIIKSSNNEIVNIPIYVNIHKLNAPDLTLYDLPGMTYKNSEITDEIRKMISQYTKDNQTLILLVLSATTDLTNSEAIEIIKKNEDYRERTLAIITKIDLVIDKEKNICSKILNNELELLFTPILVRNRTLKELEDNTSYELVREKEKVMFKSNDQLDELPESSKGTESLINQLVNLQKKKLSQSKFNIKQKIIEQIILCKEKLLKLPRPAETINEKSDRFKECLNSFIEKYRKIIKGLNHYKDLSKKGKNESFTFTIRKIFNDFFNLFDSKKFHFFSPEFKEKVIQAINDSRGFKLPNIHDSEYIHDLIKEEISSIENNIDFVIIKCKEVCRDLLYEIVDESFSAYSILQNAIKGEIKNLYDIQSGKCIFLIKELINVEKIGEWTMNPYYIDIYNKIITKITNKKEEIKLNKLTPISFNSKTIFNPKEEDEIVEINDLKIKASILYSYENMNGDNNPINFQIICFSYWNILCKRFLDYSQLILMNTFIIYFENELGLILDKLFSPNIDKNNIELIYEDISISSLRNKLKHELINLEKALEKINKIF